MQVARPTALPPLNMELAQRNKRLLNTINNPLSPGLQKLDEAEAHSSSAVEPNPLSPLSPSTFPSHSPQVAAAASPELLILNDRYLLLECIDGGISPHSQPMRRCVDTITEQVYFCRECTRSPATSLLLEAHQRLKGSDVITPICQVIHATREEEGSAKIYLLSPASYGDLHSYLRAKRRLKESEARSLFRQAAQAVYDCHSHGIVLTDLKLRRFVFADPQRTKLRLESLEEAIVLERSDSDDGVWRKHGYPAYVTPEVLLSRGARYSGRAADLWSLGIILYTLLVGRYPFQDSGPFGLFTKIIRGHFSVPDFVSSRARCLIRNLLRRDPSQRLEAGDILQHPWFTAVLRTAKADQTKSKPEATLLSASGTMLRTEPLSLDQVVPEALADSRMEE